MPTLDAHCPEADDWDGPVPITKLDAGSDLQDSALFSLFKRHLVARAEGTSLDGSVKQRMGNVAKECQLTSGTDPPTETAVSIHSDRASGKSSGVRGVVTLSHAPGVWSSHFHIVRRARAAVFLLTIARSPTASERDSSSSYSPCMYQYERCTRKLSITSEVLAAAHLGLFAVSVQAVDLHGWCSWEPTTH